MQDIVQSARLGSNSPLEASQTPIREGFPETPAGQGYLASEVPFCKALAKFDAM